MPIPYEIRRLTRSTFPVWWSRCPKDMSYGEWVEKKKTFLRERRAAQAQKRRLISEARRKASLARWYNKPKKEKPT